MHSVHHSRCKTTWKTNLHTFIYSTLHQRLTLNWFTQPLCICSNNSVNFDEGCFITSSLSPTKFGVSQSVLCEDRKRRRKEQTSIQPLIVSPGNMFPYPNLLFPVRQWERERYCVGNARAFINLPVSLFCAYYRYHKTPQLNQALRAYAETNISETIT